MAQVTLCGADEFARILFSQAALSPNEYYLALVSTGNTPDAFVTGMDIVEPEAASYVRVLIPNDQTNWQSSLPAVYSNALEVRFPTATESWGGITYWALCSAATEGYVYLWGEFVNQFAVGEGDTVIIDAESLQLEFTDIYEEISVE